MRKGRYLAFTFSLIGILMFSSILCGATKSTKELMNVALDSIINLMPYMSSDMKFSDPRFKNIITKNLESLSQAFNDARHIDDLNTVGFSPSFKIIKEHISDTVATFKSSNKVFARLRLNATAAICMSCHTQLPKNKISSFHAGLKRIDQSKFSNNFDYAEFQFLVRDYAAAERSYKRTIEIRIKKQEEFNQLNLNKTPMYFDRTIFKSIRKLLILYTKIWNIPQKGAKVLRPYSQNGALPRSMRKDISVWLTSLKRWSAKENYKKDLKRELKNDKEVLSFIKKYLTPIQKSTIPIATGIHDVDLLIASGKLYNYLNSKPLSNVTPNILYWLGIAEKQLNDTFFYSLGDLYLKECITQYPKHEMAAKCLKEYKDGVIFGFTGSAGTDIPADIKKELKSLEKLIGLN